MPRWFAYLLAVLVVIGIPPFIVLSNLYVVATPQYVDFEYNKPDFPPSVRFTDVERRTYSLASLDYIKGDLSFQEFKGLGVYNDREIKHMVDVRNLFAGAISFHANDAAVLLIALIALVWSRTTRPLAAKSLVIGAILTLVLFVGLGLFITSAFDTFFVDFHRVFFEGDTWLFFTTDSLIQFYPENFWYDTFFYVAVLVIVESVVVGGLGLFWRYRLAHAPEPAPAKKQVPSQAARRK